MINIEELTKRYQECKDDWYRAQENFLHVTSELFEYLRGVEE